MQGLRRILVNLKIFIVALLGVATLKILNKTLSWRRLGYCADRSFWSDNSPKLFAFWHNRQLMMPWLVKGWSKHPVYVLISGHTDGRMIAKIVKFLGINSITGSSTRGGTRALIAMAKRIRQGDIVVITPDGPRGPAEKVKPGVLKLAQLTGVPILPVACASNKCWRFNSWDKMILPKPFSRVVIAGGQPLRVPNKASAEQLSELTARLESELQRVTKEVEEYACA